MSSISFLSSRQYRVFCFHSLDPFFFTLHSSAFRQSPVFKQRYQCCGMSCCFFVVFCSTLLLCHGFPWPPNLSTFSGLKGYNTPIDVITQKAPICNIYGDNERGAYKECWWSVKTLEIHCSESTRFEFLSWFLLYVMTYFMDLLILSSEFRDGTLIRPRRLCARSFPVCHS
jgi:hypothetical protein